MLLGIKSISIVLQTKGLKGLGEGNHFNKTLIV